MGAVRTHSARTFALLAYLALEAGGRIRAPRWSTLLWPDLPEASGRQNLRQALYSLKSRGGWALNGCLQVDPSGCCSRLTGRPLHRHRRAPLSGRRAQRRRSRLAAGSGIHHAPLLDGPAAVPGSEFEAWLLARATGSARWRCRTWAAWSSATWHALSGTAAARHAHRDGRARRHQRVASQYLLRIFAAQGLDACRGRGMGTAVCALSQVLGGGAFGRVHGPLCVRCGSQAPQPPGPSLAPGDPPHGAAPGAMPLARCRGHGVGGTGRRARLCLQPCRRPL
jgi:hypothetical protein